MDAVAGFGEGVPELGPGSSAVRPSGDDDIDGRGSFEARELERELRRMRRGVLQVNFLPSLTFLSALIFTFD